MMCSVEKQQKNTLDICAAFHKTEPRALCEPCLRPVCCILFFLLDMFDKTRSGRMDLFGFSALWDFMQRWRVLFQQYDRDRSGSISGMELQQGISCLCEWNWRDGSPHFLVTFSNLHNCTGVIWTERIPLIANTIEVQGSHVHVTEENLLCLHATCVVSSKCGRHWNCNVNTVNFVSAAVSWPGVHVAHTSMANSSSI